MILVLTGAGISAESGIRTFRSDTGLWEEERVEDVATPGGFARDPGRVRKFYDRLHAAVTAAAPNAAHLALARLEREAGGPVTIVTQNVDDLHERAGSRNVLHIHGSVFRAFCDDCCADASDRAGRLASDGSCAACGGEIRPDIVWFGEGVKHGYEIEDALSTAKVFLSVGTAGAVHPAAGFARRAENRRARTVEFNVRPTEITRHFREVRPGAASVTVPLFVDAFLKDRLHRPG